MPAHTRAPDCPRLTFAGMQAGSPGPDPHHPVHRRCALAAASFSAGGSYRHVVNGASCATVPTLQAQTAHIRTGHAPEERGERLLSRALLLRVAGCQPRAGHPPPCAPPTERERQREECTGPSTAAPRNAPRQPGTWNHTSACATAGRSVHPPSACMKSHGVARRRSHRKSRSSAACRKS